MHFCLTNREMNVTSRSLLLVSPSCLHSYRHVSTSIRSSLLSRPRTSRSVAVASRVRLVRQQASSGQSPEDSGTLLDRLGTLSEKVSEHFAVVAVGCLALGLTFPTSFLWFDAGMVSMALGISMLAMGCTLNLEDFVILTQRPWQLFIGIALQYTIMPLTGFAISRVASLSNEIAAGDPSVDTVLSRFRCCVSFMLSWRSGVEYCDVPRKRRCRFVSCDDLY